MKLYWLSIALPLSLVACGSKDNASADKDKSEKKEEKKEKKEEKKEAKEEKKEAAKEAKSATAKEAAEEKKAAKEEGKDEAPKAGGPTDPASKPADPAPAKPADASTDLPAYSFAKVTKIPDSCASPYVILANAPESVGADYDWKWSKQALLANPEFHTTAGAPSGQWSVSFEVHQLDATMNNAYALIAHCGDGLTCNNLAAMNLAAVKSSHPQLICGTLPASFGAPLKTFDLLAGGPQANLPTPSDAISSCARISACTAFAKPADTNDIGLDCQKAPSSFKLDCSSHPSCAEVTQCLGK